MSTPIASVSPGDLTSSPSYVGDNDLDDGASTSVMMSQFSTPDPDEMMLPADEGATGLVGPVTGAQHMPNAAQPGTM